MIKVIYRYRLPMFGLAILLLMVISNIYIPSVTSTPHSKIFTIKEGATVRGVANDLVEQDFIRSVSLFILLVYLNDGIVQEGNYFFRKSHSVYSYVSRMTSGRRDAPIAKVVVPEGSNVFEITEIILKEFPAFDTDEFIQRAAAFEGRLYPETYFFFRDETPAVKDIIRIMTTTFDYRVKDLLDKYNGEFSTEEILKIASIVELESWKKEDQKKIAGVIRNRLEKGIPLQVDVAFRRINGKNTFNLTRSDLKLEDPYNTYVNKGLPPTPIGSPGFDAIDATINYVESDYLFFLSDRNGTTYFSETFDEHVRYKRNYLR